VETTWRAGCVPLVGKKKEYVLMSLLAAHLLPLILGHQQEVTLGAALNPLSSVPCNVHFAVLILDRLTLALFPELGIDPSSS
jgi:hypothetical protein